MADRLSIYNDALLLCGESRLKTLTDNREARHTLDTVWNNGAINACLEEAIWNFAVRATRPTYATDIEPPWGYRRAYQKPDDWIQTDAIASDEFFASPLTRFEDEGGYWYCDLDEIFVRYVSNDASYGNDMGKWTQSFTDYVSAHLAQRIVKKLTKDKQRHQMVEVELRDRRLNAKNKDARGEPTRFRAPGAWSSSRYGRRGSRGPRGDGGSPGSLTG